MRFLASITRRFRGGFFLDFLPPTPTPGRSRGELHHDPLDKISRKNPLLQLTRRLFVILAKVPIGIFLLGDGDGFVRGKIEVVVVGRIIVE